MRFFAAILIAWFIGPASAQTPQWDDFPGGRRVDFSGYSWRIKGPGVYGPGPNYFSDQAPNVELLESGALALRITRESGRWQSAEVVLERPLGYGRYHFMLDGPVDVIDPNAVLGLFLWEYKSAPLTPGNSFNEFDIELSRWGVPFNVNAQFVAQPYQTAGNLERFPFALPQGGGPVSFMFDWRPDEVRCAAWRGHASMPTDDNLIHEWVYTGPDIPRLEEPRVHMNLWLIFGEPPTSGESVETLVSGFAFEALCPADLNADGELNGLDFGAWLGAYSFGEPVADQNRDGVVNGLDFGAWLANFSAGCPAGMEG